MVREVKRVLARGPCTLSQLTAELGARRELVRSALHFWISRGDVVLEAGRLASGCAVGSAAKTSHCAPCGIVPPAAGPAVYRWRDSE